MFLEKDKSQSLKEFIKDHPILAFFGLPMNIYFLAKVVESEKTNKFLNNYTASGNYGSGAEDLDRSN